MTTTDLTIPIPFPADGLAIALPEGRRVFVGKSMGRVGIAFYRPALSENEQSVFGKAVTEQHLNGASVATVMISWEAAVALCELLNVALIPPPTPKIWEALSQDGTRVIATGNSYGEAVDNAEKAGETDPIMTIRRQP